MFSKFSKTKKLILCRHADALPAARIEHDLDRKLSEDGIVQAQQGKNWLLQLLAENTTLVCSSATRAIETAKIISGAFPGSDLEIHKELYECPASGILRFLSSVPENFRTVVFIGHNPGISYFASNLTNRDINFSTGQIVVIDLETEKWNQISYGTATVKDFFLPE
ncbi:MAG: hypothetical protein EOP53_27395 [Sphingobacteriales bacterium]|nr:MAG: hypothetical protein EOP53_27395 [Sphingobacteriales bacterium]